MAIDISILKGFDVIFVFLLVLVIVYALLQRIKIFGDSKAIHAMIAFVFAIFSLFSEVAIRTILTAAPWFVLLVFLILFFLITFMAFGVKEKDFLAVMQHEGEYTYVKYLIIALVLIISLGSLAHSITRESGGFPGYRNGTVDNLTTALAGEGAPQQESEFWKTFFHPKILGMVVILLIAVFAISRLTHDKL